MGKIEDRLSVLEGELRRVRELADQAAERPAGHGPVRNPRLAKTFHADGVAYPAAPCTVYPIVFLDSTYTQTAGDRTPTDTARQAHAAALAYYGGEDYLAEGTVVYVLWDHLRWWILEGPGSGGNILWAIIQSGTNDTAQLSRVWSVKACDWARTISGDAFDIITPPLGAGTKCNKDTALFAGYLVGYQIEPDGAKVIVTDVYDDPMGTVRMMDGSAATGIPDGWEDVASQAGRFVLGYSSDAGGDPPHGYEVGPGSGPAWNAGHQLLHTHCAHANTTKLEGAGGNIYPFLADNGGVHNDVDTCPPYITFRLIKRAS